MERNMPMYRKRAFYRMLVSYVVILLIPLSTLSFLIFARFFQTYDELLIKNRIESVETVQDTVNLLISQMDATGNSVFSTRTFTTAYLEEAYGHFYTITRSLSNITFTNQFVRGIYYLNADLGKIFTPTTMYTYNDFQTFYEHGYADWSGDALADAVLHSEGRWLPAHPLRDGHAMVLTYLFYDRLSISRGGVPRGVLLFQIDTDTIDKLMGDHLDSKGSGLIITDAAGEILYDGVTGLTPDVLSSLFEGDMKSGAVEEVNIDSHHYIVYHSKSASTRLGYTTVIPYDDVMQPLYEFRRLTQLALLVVVLVGCLVIYRLTRYNYAPVQNLLTLAINRDPQVDGKRLGEYEIAENALQHLSDANQMLREDHLTYRLLRGDIRSLKALENAGGVARYALHGPLFCIAAAQMTAEGQRQFSPDVYGGIIQYIQGALGDVAQMQPLRYPERQSMYLILSGERSTLHKAIERLTASEEEIALAFGVAIVFGIGEICDITDIPSSFAQAEAACERSASRMLDEQDLDEIPFLDGAMYRYPSANIRAFYRSIRSGKPERIDFSLDLLQQNLASIQEPLRAIRLVYEAVSAAGSALKELNIPCQALEAKVYSLLLNEEAYACEALSATLGEFGEKVRHMVQADTDITTKPLRSSRMERIVEYIDVNCCREDFSLKALTDHFSMSISNFSHQFKKTNGITVTDYIVAQRITRAKELLLSTDMVLMEISSQCGYLHVATFIRQFKKQTNMTPTEFRTAEGKRRSGPS